MIQPRVTTPGTAVPDWIVPDAWTMRSAVPKGLNGEVVADLAVSNLHVIGLSETVEVELALDEVRPHLHSTAEN